MNICCNRVIKLFYFRYERLVILAYCKKILPLFLDTFSLQSNLKMVHNHLRLMSYVSILNNQLNNLRLSILYFFTRNNIIHCPNNKIMSISQIQIKSLQHLLNKRQQIAAANALPVGLPDASAYYFLKEATFLSKKQQRWIFYLFQGLNTNPQNLSIYLRDEAQRQGKASKQKLIKGVFMIYDLYNRNDVVIQINIPGNLKIYKLQNGKKELVNNEQIDQAYLSSALRSMYQVNLPWGRFFHLFHDGKSYIEQLRTFFKVYFRSSMKKDINLGGEYQSQVNIKGSHSCSLILNYIIDRRLVRQSIQVIQDLINKNKEYAACSKFCILLAELYLQLDKASKSLQIIFNLFQTYSNDPYLIFYQAKYLYKMSMYQQALSLCDTIVQYNQFQIWILLAQIHLQLKNFADVLVCLNHAIKHSKIKGIKNLDIIYKSFEQLGKIKYTGTLEGIQHSPKLLISSDSPLSILVKEVEQKNKGLIQKGYWRLNSNQKLIYNISQHLRYRLDVKKFEELLTNTFQQNFQKYQAFSIRRGMAESLFGPQQVSTQKNIHEAFSNIQNNEQEDLPDFLKNSTEKIEDSVIQKQSRNLSIIQQIQSVIQNSNYEQREKQKNNKTIRYKREVNEGLYKIIQYLLSETQFEKAQYELNLAKIMNTYNKMRTSSKFNNYFADKMFKIFMQTFNYKSIVILIAETLDFMEQKGIKKIDKLPYWIHKYLFFIIEQKGLKFLNDMLQKLNFYDQAVIDTIQIAKNWKMKGITY